MMKLEAFENYIHKMNDLSHAAMLLSWDLKTKAPKNASDSHISALTTLSTEVFKMSTDEELRGYIEDIENHEKELDEVTVGMAKKLKKEYVRSKNIPTALYSQFVALTSKAEYVWEGAKRQNDFNSFQPYLEQIVELSKEMAHYIDPTQKAYDVLLEDFEPGIKSDQLTVIFEELRKGVVPLVEAIKTKAPIDDSQFYGHFDKEEQRKIAHYLLKQIGYNMDSGRLDESEHPFTIGTAPFDVRITTHYLKEDARSSIFSVLHEGGHGIYEQNINPRLKGTPLATGTSMGIHESQSRLYENIIGRSKAFWAPLYEEVIKIIPQYKALDLEDFYRGINRIEPSLIRTEADELTYNLHIILRFELEMALFNNEIKVKDLPEAWRYKMKKYLGVVPETDAEGVLQDTHWAGGAFGYFPSYALGNVYGAQFVHQIEKEKGYSLESLLQRGQLDTVSHWLKEHIHQYGALKTPSQLIREACGEDINVRPLLTYYQNKYTQLYKL